MRIDEARKIIRFLAEIGEVPILVGEAGIGKTQIIKEIGKETGREVRILTLSQMEPGDLLGLPVRDEESNVTRFLAPDWWPESGDTIIFLDEINRSHPSVRAAVMQLLLDKRLHNHVLPDGTWVVAAMNPETNDYQVDAIFDRAFIDRFVWIAVTNDVESWYSYMTAKNAGDVTLLGVIKEYFATQPDVLVGFRMPELPEILPTPRALERFVKVVTLCPKELRTFLPEISLGILGKHGPKILAAYEEKMKNEITYETLLAGDITAVKKASSQARVDALDALVSYLIANTTKDGTINVPATQLENAARCLEVYRPEEMAVLFRITNKKHQYVFKAWKQASPVCRKILTGFVLKHVKDATDIEKIQM